MGAETEKQAVEPIQVVVVLRLLVKSPPHLHRMRTPGRAARELMRQWGVTGWVAASSGLVMRLRQGLPSRMLCYQGKAVKREKKE